MVWHPTDLSADTATVALPRRLVLGERALLVAAWNGSWYAIEDRCSHAGCTFSEDGEIDGPHVVCNCHGSEFDLRTGLPVRRPARDPIRIFPVRVAAGLLEVDV